MDAVSAGAGTCLNDSTALMRCVWGGGGGGLMTTVEFC